MDDTFDLKDSERIKLEKIRLALHVPLSKHVLDAGVDVIRIMEEEVEFSLHGYLWGNRSKTTDISYPADWWQWFKQRWFPKWLLARFPPKMTTHTVSVSRIFPDFKNPQLGRETYLPIYHEIEWR